MSDQPLIEDTNAGQAIIHTGKNYRATSIAGVTTIQPTQDDATFKAQNLERLATVGD
jgi:hypothetical protein